MASHHPTPSRPTGLDDLRVALLHRQSVPWHQPAAYRPDAGEMLRDSWAHDESECVEDMLGDAPSWTEIAVVTAAVVALVLFVFAINEGWLF